MKNKVAALLIILLVICSLLVIFILSKNNYELNAQLEIRDNLIRDGKYRDSIYTSQTKDYSEIITKYVSNCQYRIGDKRIGSDELVKLINDKLEENSLLKDSVNYYKKNLKKEIDKELYLKSLTYNYADSIDIYKSAYNLVKKKYGINCKIIKTNGYIKIITEISKADSALVLLPYYRDKIRRDTIQNCWIITYEQKEIRSETSKRKRKDK